VTGVTGGAYGLGAAGLIPIPATPTVTLPPDGSPQSATALSAGLPLVVQTGALTVTTSSSGVPGAAGQVTSTATVDGTDLLGGALQATAVGSTCTSAAGGSTASTTVTGLTVDGSSITVPNPIPPNFGIDVPGVATVELNRQITSNSAGSTSTVVDGVYAQVLGALGGLTTVTVAESTCGATGPDVNAAPTVTSVAPSQGPEAGGTSVTVTGTDFSGVSSVDFGATPASDVVVDSPTQLTATAPAGTGTVDVTVTDADGTSPTDPSADGFTYVPAPTVTGVSPDSGPATGGQTVTVTGTNLTGGSVDFGGTPATGVSCTETTCTATVPAGTSGTTVPVTVTTPDGTSATTPASQYTYGTAPSVTGLSPTSGPAAGGTTVTLTGANFTGATGIDFGPTPATSFDCTTATTCTAVSPAGTAGTTVPVEVTTPDGTSPSTTAGDFTYAAVPAVTSISPSTGPTAGGTTVTITGTGLCDPTGVDFGGTPAAGYTVDSGCDQITATSPPGSGTVDVTVTTPGGTSPTTTPDQYTYAPLPAPLSVSPSAGPVTGGTETTITGSGLLGATAIDFGTVPATSFVCTSDTTCDVVTPAATAAGPEPVSVTGPGGTSNASTDPIFTYTDAPVVSSLSPDTGPPVGGTTVAITGTGFAGATAVDFGGTPATSFSCTTATACTAVSPAGPSDTTVPVTVVTPDGTSAATPGGDFTYGTAPAVDGVTPSDGPLAGGTTVTISGANLTGGTVDFGGTPATDVTCADATTCTAVAPAGTGTVDVTVTTPSGGTSPTVPADAYTYLPVPTVGPVSPLSGPTAGGTMVTITGTGLTGTSAIDFGSIPSTSFTCSSDTSCTAVSPPGVGGAVYITATTPGGTSPTGPSNLFTYVSPYPYHAVSPYRIADTRKGSGEPLAGEKLGPGSTATVQVTGTGSGTDAVPADATVAVLNVTSTDTTGTSFFTAYPTGNARPKASNLNFVKGATVPNLVEVALGTGGRVNVYNNAGSADLVVDVEGYVGPAVLGDTAGRYNPLSPYRITDTRTGSGEPNAGKTLGHGCQGAPAGGTLGIQVTGQGGVPASGVSAVVLNVTATDETALGYVTVYPAGAVRPKASNVNTVPHSDVANRVIVPVGAGGRIDAFNCNGTTDLVVDVDGWFTDATTSSGYLYSGLQPARIADTRRGSGEPEAGMTLGSGRKHQPSATLTMTVAGTGGVPTMSSAHPPTSVVLNVTETDATAISHLTVYPAGEALPTASDLNWTPGQTRANLVVVKLNQHGQISMFNWSGQVDVVVDVVGYYSAAQSGT
jgi:hypothetical protein